MSGLESSVGFVRATIARHQKQLKRQNKAPLTKLLLRSDKLRLLKSRLSALKAKEREEVEAFRRETRWIGAPSPSSILKKTSSAQQILSKTLELVHAKQKTFRETVANAQLKNHFRAMFNLEKEEIPTKIENQLVEIHEPLAPDSDLLELRTFGQKK